MIKTLNGMYGIPEDELVKLLPLVLVEIRNYTNQYFLTNYSQEILHITDNKLYFDKSPIFEVGNTIEILNSSDNFMVYQVKEVGSDYVELEQVVSNEQSIHLRAIKLAFRGVNWKTIADMVNYSINFSGATGIKAQSLGGYSVTWNQVENGGTLFPLELYGGINSLRKMNDDYAEYWRKGYARIQ